MNSNVILEHEKPDFLLTNLKSTFLGSAVLKYSVGDFLGAKKELIYLQKENQENSEFFYLLGLISYHLGNIKDSVSHFSKCINLKPNLNCTGYGYFHRGISHLSTGNYINSEDDFKHSIQLFPDFEILLPYANLYLGISEIYLGKYDMSIVDLNQAVSMLEDYPEPYVWRSYCHLMLNDKKSSCTDLKKALLLGADDISELLLRNCK